MKKNWLEIVYVILLAVVFGGVVLHAPISVGFGTAFPGFELAIKAWKEIIMLLLIPVAASIITKRQLWRQLINDWVIRLIIAYAILHILSITWLWKGGSAVAAGLAIDLRYVLFFGLVYVAIRALPRCRQWFIKGGIVGAGVVVGFATIQLFLPADFPKVIGYGKDTIEPYLTVDKNPDFVRINSTLRGPNPLGAYVVMVLAIVAALVLQGKVLLRRRKVAIGVSILAICSVIALWVSYSRSARLAAIVSMGIVAVVAWRKHITRQLWIASIVAGGLVVGAVMTASGNGFVSNVILHENPRGGSDISSNEGHIESLALGVERVVHQPLGAGVGSTGSASLYSDVPVIIENQYLFIAHEVGWLGLGIFLGLSSLVLVRLWQAREEWLGLGTFASGIGLALIGLLLPVWVDDTVSIVWWGLAAIVLAGGKNE